MHLIFAWRCRNVRVSLTVVIVLQSLVSTLARISLVNMSLKNKITVKRDKIYSTILAGETEKPRNRRLGYRE